MSIIFHLDLDAFFVSVEEIIDPSIKGLPVIVGADPDSGRGVISTCSYAARKFGLHSGMPIAEAFRKCPNGIYLRGHMKAYSFYSKQVKNLLSDYAPEIEQASIDEFYMDFTGTEKIYGNHYDFAKFLQKEIFDKIKLPSSIGIATNKTIAKIASDYRKPMGITEVKSGKEKDFLLPLKISAIPGVGKVFTRNLHKLGIYYVKDVFAYSERYLESVFGKSGKFLWKKANGFGKSRLNHFYNQKSISKERTFKEDIYTKKYLEKTLFKLTEQVSQELRNKNKIAATISIKLRYSDFQTFTRSKTVNPTNDDKIIFDIASELLNKMNKRRAGIRLIGVALSNFKDSTDQLNLFDNQKIIRANMFSAVNSIRNKFGFTSINVGIK